MPNTNTYTLSQFDPNQEVFALDRTKEESTAVIKSFRPVQREGRGDRHWSYLVHFQCWSSRHDEWVDEDDISSTSASTCQDDDAAATCCETQTRLTQVEEEQRALKDEVRALKEAEKVLLRRIEEESSRSYKKRRSSSTRAAKTKTEAATKKRKQPKRDSGDISMRRNLLLSFLVVSDNRQSDDHGCGVIARRDIRKGELFEDRVVTYEEGPPPKSLDEWRYISLGSGYFRLANSLAEMINQPLDGQEANVMWYCTNYQEEGRPLRKVLRIRAMRDIHEGEEILVAYRSI